MFDQITVSSDSRPDLRIWEKIPSRDFRYYETHTVTGLVVHHFFRPLIAALETHEYTGASRAHISLYRKYSALEYKIGMHFHSQIQNRFIMMAIGKMTGVTGGWTLQLEPVSTLSRNHYLTVCKLKL